MIDADRLRSMFLAFFAEHGHAILPSASLIAEGDPSVLFTAGVHPLLPYLLGRLHPAGGPGRYQKCLRTTDIDQVGDATHLTFFEMLGNWSLGARFKQESIAWAMSCSPATTSWRSRRSGCGSASSPATRPPADADHPASGARARSRPAGSSTSARSTTGGRWGPRVRGPDTGSSSTPPASPASEASPSACPEPCDCGRFVEVWNNVFHDLPAPR